MMMQFVCAQGVPTKTSLLSDQKTQVKINDRSQIKKTTQNQLMISMQAESYLQSSELADSSEQAFLFRHQFDFKKGQNSVRTNLILGGYQKNKSYFGAVPELYYQHFSTDTVSQKITNKYTLGRQILDASHLDQKFNLGLVNPYYTQDFISYQSQGLIGFHQEISSENWAFNISLLPLYLPNQGPTVKEVDGKIQGSNRWVKKPPTKLAFNDASKEIIYTVDYSDISKLVLTPGALAQFRLGQLKNKIHWVTSVSKRPMNETVLERETFGNLDVIGNVNLVPNVIYNDLLTTEVRYQNQHFRSALSYVTDRPENKTARDFYSIQKLNSISGYSVYFEYDVPSLENRSVLLGMAYANFFGGEIIDINSDGTENLLTFSKQRLQFLKPMQLYIKADLFKVYNKLVKNSTKWIYDQQQKGSVLSSEFNAQTLNNLNLRLGFDLIGTEEQKTEDYGFLQDFQANDRIYAGLDYVF